jgi:hypothetical protein
MEGVKFENVRQVEDLYESLIEAYNEVLIDYEELEAIDDDIQELRNTTLDKYDYSLMAEAYVSLGEKETADELEEKAKECQELIESLQEKLEGINVNEHLAKFYAMEIRKENFDIQMKACEKFLEKSQRKREMEKMKGNLRPASPRKFPNLTRVPSPRFIAESSTEEDDSLYSTTDEEEAEESSHTPDSPPPSPPKKEVKKKPAPAKINLIPVSSSPAPVPEPAPVPSDSKKESKKSKDSKKESEPEAPKQAPKDDILDLPPPPEQPSEKKKGGRKKAN